MPHPFRITLPHNGAQNIRERVFCKEKKRYGHEKIAMDMDMDKGYKESTQASKRNHLMAQTAIVEKTVYNFDELSETAKQNAIEKYAANYDWWDSCYDDFVQILDILGFEVESKDIEFSGFYQQGSYAAFSGYYHFQKDMVKGIKSYAPKDKELHRIAKELSKMQRKCFYSLSAKFRYSDYSGYSVDMEDSRRQYGWVDSDEPEKIFRQVLKDLSSWLYEKLQNEYEYLTSEESFKESCEANEWTFDENGNIDYL